MKNKYLIIGFGIISILVFSCKKSAPEDTNKQAPLISNGEGVFITHEGNFQAGNATISYYDKTNKKVSNSIYSTINNKSLGDVCQSIFLYNGNAYIVVNNSGKIIVVDALTFQEKATISGLISPRYFLPINNEKAYVTDLYSNKIAVINLQTHTIEKYIPLKGWTEQLLLWNNKVYVCNKRKPYLYIINPSNDEIEDSILIRKGANSLQLDANNLLWVLCDSSKTDNSLAALYQINLASKNVVKGLVFNSAIDAPRALQINEEKNKLFFINQGVFSMNIADAILPNIALIKANGRNFYGLGIDPILNELYISDATDFVQQGLVYRTTANGATIDSFRTAIIPGNFTFN